MKGIVERFEQRYVVIELEDGHQFLMSYEKLPQAVQIGDVIILTDDYQFLTRNEQQTALRRKNIERLSDDLFEE